MTGDLGRRDPDGSLWFWGRQKMLIGRRGSDIAPPEIEELLDAHPAIHAAVVVGVPDRRDIEVPLVWLQAQPGVTSPDAETMRTYLAQRLAANKLPLHVLPTSEVPRNSTGKIDRRQLRERAISQLAPDG